MRAVGPSQISAEVCSCHLSCLLLLIFLPSQMVSIGLWPCETDTSVLAVVVCGGQLRVHLGIGSLSRNSSTLLINLGHRSQKPGPPRYLSPLEQSRMPAASAGPAGTFVGGPSSVLQRQVSTGYSS